MQVQRKEFLDQLTKVQAALGKKYRFDQAGCFIFTDGKIVAYDELSMIVSPTSLELEGAVYADELLQILNKLKTDAVTLTVGESEIVLKAGRSKSGIRYEQEVLIPVSSILEAYAEDKAVKVPDGLLPALKRAKFCAAKRDNDGKFNGIQVREGAVYSTDRYRIFQAPVKGGKKLPTFLIPYSCVDAVAAHEPTHMHITDKWAFFRNAEGLLICVRLIHPDADDPYPDLADHMAVEGHELIMPPGILDAIDKANVFTKTAHEDEMFVELSLKPGQVVVRGEGGFGWYEESVVAKEYQGEAVTFASHPEFLRDILPLVQTATLGENTILFEGEDFKYVFVLSNQED